LETAGPEHLDPVGDPRPCGASRVLQTMVKHSLEGSDPDAESEELFRANKD
jgi:hypothetical protein